MRYRTQQKNPRLYFLLIFFPFENLGDTERNKKKPSSIHCFHLSLFVSVSSVTRLFSSYLLSISELGQYKMQQKKEILVGTSVLLATLLFLERKLYVAEDKVNQLLTDRLS